MVGRNYSVCEDVRERLTTPHGVGLLSSCSLNTNGEEIWYGKLTYLARLLRQGVSGGATTLALFRSEQFEEITRTLGKAVAASVDADQLTDEELDAAYASETLADIFFHTGGRIREAFSYAADMDEWRRENKCTRSLELVGRSTRYKQTKASGVDSFNLIRSRSAGLQLIRFVNPFKDFIIDVVVTDKALAVGSDESLVRS
jgi:hypothetical protein